MANDGKAHLQAVVVGRSFGADAEILAGLAKDDWVAVNAPALLSDGDPVNVIRREPSAETTQIGTK